MQGSKSSFFTKTSKHQYDEDHHYRGGGDSKKVFNQHKQERQNAHWNKAKNPPQEQFYDPSY